MSVFIRVLCVVPTPFVKTNSQPAAGFESGLLGQAVAAIVDSRLGLSITVPIRIGGSSTSNGYNNDVWLSPTYDGTGTWIQQATSLRFSPRAQFGLINVALHITNVAVNILVLAAGIDKSVNDAHTIHLNVNFCMMSAHSTVRML